jgi:hypothetical protein
MTSAVRMLEFGVGIANGRSESFHIPPTDSWMTARAEVFSE